MKKLIPFLCLAFVLAAAAQAQIPPQAQTPQVQTQLGDITDSRTTGQFFAGLEVNIKLLGDVVADAVSLQRTVKTAMDDTGRDLIDHEKEKNKFEKLHRNSGQGAELKLKLKNPSRKAATIKELTGEAELFVPKNDPDAIVKVPDFQKSGGKKIELPSLAAAGIELTIYTKEQQAAEKAKDGGDFGSMFNMGGGPNDINVQIKDPSQKLVDIEFQDASGEKIKTNGWSAMGEPKQMSKTFIFSSKLPDNAVLVIYLSTPKSMITVPFTLTNVPLP
jgi:hypothetical protein